MDKSPRAEAVLKGSTASNHKQLQNCLDTQCPSTGEVKITQTVSQLSKAEAQDVRSTANHYWSQIRDSGKIMRIF
jgi:hypothetical protein